MRREVTDHGWPVADEMSYPQVEHRDPDGLMRPLMDRDVRIASACATSLSAFFVTNRKAFEADGGEPICQSYTDDRGRLVRFTFPYEAFPLFDVGTDPQPPNPGSRRAPLRRNDPCHFGSGRKYVQAVPPGHGPTHEIGFGHGLTRLSGWWRPGRVPVKLRVKSSAARGIFGELRLQSPGSRKHGAARDRR